MSSPINAMIDAVVRCTKCGAGIGGCNCWATIVATIVLRCPKCKRTKQAQKLDTDYSETAAVEIVCPKCDDGDFHEPSHFDAAGKHITRDPHK